MRLLFNIYIRALMRGNPIAVAFTAVLAVAISVGPVYEGISKRDPVAIGMMVGVDVLFAIMVAVAIVDRRSQDRARRPPPKGGSRTLR